MRLIDIGGSLEHGKSVVPELFPPIIVDELAPREGRPYTVYHQTVFTHMQASTYLETGAHLYKGLVTIDQLPLERCFLNAVVLKIPKEADEYVTSALIEQALVAEAVSIHKGDALLIGTGWDKNWCTEDSCPKCPHFTAEAMVWIVDQGVSLFGTDTPWVDSKANPKIDYQWFFSTDVLFLIPLVNLMSVRKPRVKLVVLPLKVVGACAGACRAVVIEDDRGDWPYREC